MHMAWKEGMSEWKRIFEIEELRHLIIGIYNLNSLCIESNNEVLDEVVQSYVQKLGKPSGKKEEKASESSASEDEEDGNAELFYFSRQEKCYKVFDPVSKKWTA